MGFDRRYVPGLAVLLAHQEKNVIDTLLEDLTVRSEDRVVVDAGVDAAAASAWLTQRWALVAAEIAKRKPGGVPPAPKLQPALQQQAQQLQLQQQAQTQTQTQAQPQAQAQAQAQPQAQAQAQTQTQAQTQSQQ